MEGRGAAQRGLGGGVIFLIYGGPASKTVIMGPACTHEHDYTRVPHYQLHTILSGLDLNSLSHICTLSRQWGAGQRAEPSTLLGCQADTVLQPTPTEAQVGHKRSHLETLSAQISEATFPREASWAEGHPGDV